MISERLLSLVCCPNCRRALRVEPSELTCDACGTRYARTGDFVDLRPAEHFSEQTKYLDEDLHADARHETVSPPLLSAGVRYRMLRKFLQVRPGDRVLDLGCGSGRVAVWNHETESGGISRSPHVGNTSRPHFVGVDVSPFFAREACESVDLVLGDLRRLPFVDGAFNKAYALDVFEHLSPDALRQVLDEAARALEPGGRLFAYSHVRRNARIAIALRGINRLARALERAGFEDLSQERLRKSDHVNPLVDISDLERTVARSGFRVVRIRYYTPILAGFVENVLLRVTEHWLTKRTRHGADERSATRVARTAAKARLARRGPTYAALRLLTWLLYLDVVLWGRIRSGPFFVLLEKERA